jgi:hypothetical protein
MKTSEAERATKEANDAEKKRADLEKKLADAELKVSKTQEKYERERANAQRKALDDLRRSTQRSAEHFAPRRLGDAVAERSLADPPPIRGVARSPKHDVFLSHASEDKDGFARPL